MIRTLIDVYRGAIRADRTPDARRIQRRIYRAAKTFKGFLSDADPHGLGVSQVGHSAGLAHGGLRRAGGRNGRGSHSRGDRVRGHRL